jgi:hypothetical protein
MTALKIDLNYDQDLNLFGKGESCNKALRVKEFRNYSTKHFKTFFKSFT